jgi:Flp pilus assembly pilin Flp
MFISSERGQDVIEYALLVSFISVVAIATIEAIGPAFSQMYHHFIVDKFIDYICS